MQGTNRSGKGGEERCYVTPDLSYDWEGERKTSAKKTNGMGKKQQQNNNTHTKWDTAVPREVPSVGELHRSDTFRRSLSITDYLRLVSATTAYNTQGM